MKNFVFMTNCPSSPDICLIKELYFTHLAKGKKPSDIPVKVKMKREASFKRLHHLVSDKTEKLPRERSLLGSTNHTHKPWEITSRE